MDAELKREISRISLLWPFLPRDQIRRKAKESLRKKGLSVTGSRTKKMKNDENNNIAKSENAKKITKDVTESNKYDVYDISDSETEIGEIESISTMRYRRNVNNGHGSGSISESLTDLAQNREPERQEIVEQAKQNVTVKSASELFDNMMVDIREKENVRRVVKVSVTTSPIRFVPQFGIDHDTTSTKMAEKQIQIQMYRTCGIQVDLRSEVIAEEVWHFGGKTETSQSTKSVGIQIDYKPVMKQRNEFGSKKQSKMNRTIGTQTELVIVKSNKNGSNKDPEYEEEKENQRSTTGTLCTLFDTPPSKKKRFG